MSFNAKNTLLFGLALLAAALAPVGISSKFYLDVLTLIFFTAYIGQSWNILGGYAGQFSFGGVMFFGTGAYTSSILLVTFGIPPLIGIFAAVLMGAFLGFLVGYLSFRSGLHIGSQLTDLEPFEKAYQKLADLTQILRQDGHTIKRLDLGGGLGIPYEKDKSAPPLPVEYGKMVRKVLGHLDCEIEIEPGRLIVGNAGILVSSVLCVKNGDNRNFLILDAAMNDLIRPAHIDVLPTVIIEVCYTDSVGKTCEVYSR